MSFRTLKLLLINAQDALWFNREKIKKIKYWCGLCESCYLGKNQVTIAYIAFHTCLTRYLCTYEVVWRISETKGSICYFVLGFDIPLQTQFFWVYRNNPVSNHQSVQMSRKGNFSYGRYWSTLHGCRIQYEDVHEQAQSCLKYFKGRVFKGDNW